MPASKEEDSHRGVMEMPAGQPAVKPEIRLKITRFEDRVWVVKLPQPFCDKDWADGMGRVQKRINAMAKFQEKISKMNHVQEKLLQLEYKRGRYANKIQFDFRECHWANPLPLMSVLVDVFFARKNGIWVEIKLPDPDTEGPKSHEINPSQQETPNRMLKFLNDEGFFDSLDQHFENDVDLVYPRKAARQKYRSMRVQASYEDARCVPMTLYEVPTVNNNASFARKRIDELLRGVYPRLDGKVASSDREWLIYKLHSVMQEVLLNAQEHAYAADEILRPLAIYVRYRTGGRDVFKRQTKTEHDGWKILCPRLDADWLETRPGFLEVFVLDRGKGMVESLVLGGVVERDEKFKFRRAIVETFCKGRSSKPVTVRKTAYGGLNLLHSLLTVSGDYIRGLDDGTWVGAVVPIHRLTADYHDITIPRNEKNGMDINGLALHFRLGWKTEPEFDQIWDGFKPGKGSELWSVLSATNEECSPIFSWFSNQLVIDDRFDMSSLEKNDCGRKYAYILWLVRRRLMKWDIYSFIEKKLVKFLQDGATLVIADIPSHEAETYVAALANTGHIKNDGWPKKIARIILCTNRWRFAVMEYESKNGGHGFSEPKGDFKNLGLSFSSPGLKIDLWHVIVHWIKWHDSILFWKEIRNRGSTFISERVLWEHDPSKGIRIEIEGFLDFPQAARNKLCADIFRSSLARVLGVLLPDQVRMVPLDLLTMTVLRDIHATEVYRQPETQPSAHLAVGSVLVSGSTMDSSGTHDYDLHFFIHRNSSLRGKNPSLLHWLPELEVSNESPRYERIGKTAAIAQGGWKSLEVPRFDQKGKLVGRRNPEETYDDWQSIYPVIFKAGHWSYQGHHDFLTINIATAVNIAFLEKNSLACFLAQKILPFIGLSKEHLLENYASLLGDCTSGVSETSSKSKIGGLLVYRSHPNTELVIRKLFKMLKPEVLETANKQIFLILSIRMRWGGSTFLISPFERKKIKDAIDKVKKYSKGSAPPVMIFDDAAITGRTLYDLKAMLSSIGAEQVSTVVIVNRLRQPADGVGTMFVQYFWRMDIPVMGRDGSCPLCNAINLTEEFAKALAHNEAKTEVQRWKQQWEAVSPIINWSRGVKPVPLANPELGKKFCVRMNESGDFMHEFNLNLTYSTGLAAHVAELYAMTGRDNYFLKKIKEHRIKDHGKEKSEVRVEQGENQLSLFDDKEPEVEEPEVCVELAASQLLLFGDESDMKIRIKLIKALIRGLAHLKTGAEHSRLAILTIFLGLSMLDSNETKKSVLKTITKDKAYLANYSCRVFLAYLVKSELLEPNILAYKIGKRLLSTDQLSMAARLREIFLETLSPVGNPHSEAIPMLFEKIRHEEAFETERILDAFDSLVHLENLIKGLDKTMARRSSASTYDSNFSNWTALSEKAKGDLQKLLKNEENLVQQRIVKSSLNEYLKAVRDVASAYFFIIPSASEYRKKKPFINEMEREVIVFRTGDWENASQGKETAIGEYHKVVKISKMGTIRFGRQNKEVWIAWYYDILSILHHLIRNAVHATEKITDPWDDSSESTADMWVLINFSENAVDIRLANASSCGSDELNEKLKPNKNRWCHLAQIGGEVKVCYDTPKQDVVVVQVIIPYAAHLTDRKEG
jgi:hypothetical protein